MITYVAVIVVVAAVLFGSFRALAGGAPLASEGYREMLGTIAERVAARAAVVTAVLAQPPTEPSRLGDVAAEARKVMAASQQDLGRLDTDPGGGAVAVLDSARALLSAAIEDYGWACRMLEAGTHRDNPGVQAAVAALMRHGDECLAAARGVVGTDQAALPAGASPTISG